MRGRGLRWAAWSAIAIAIALSVVLASRFGTDPGLVRSPLLDKPAPGFDLPRLGGNGSVSLADLQDKIVILNFFASWCLECRLEHPALIAAADSFAERDVVLVQIAFHDDETGALGFLETEGTSINGEYLSDPGSRAAISYGVFGIPETFFIDRNGVVVGKVIGEIDAYTLGTSLDAILKGESPGQSRTGNTQQRPDA